MKEGRDSEKGGLVPTQVKLKTESGHIQTLRAQADAIVLASTVFLGASLMHQGRPILGIIFQPLRQDRSIDNACAYDLAACQVCMNSVRRAMFPETVT